MNFSSLFWSNGNISRFRRLETKVWNPKTIKQFNCRQPFATHQHHFTKLYNKKDRSNRSLIHKISFRPKLKNTALLPYLLAVLVCVQSWSHFPWSKFAFVNFFLSWRRFWFSSYCYKFNKRNQLSPVLSPFLCSIEWVEFEFLDFSYFLGKTILAVFFYLLFYVVILRWSQSSRTTFIQLIQIKLSLFSSSNLLDRWFKHWLFCPIKRLI